MATNVNPMRIRQILAALSKEQQKKLRALLPLTVFALPAAETLRYPSALLGALPAGQNYSVLGCVAEDLLKLTPADITVDALIAAVNRWVVGWPTDAATKVRKSKTTEPFLAALCETRQKMLAVIREPLMYGTEVTVGTVSGHPDANSATQIFEVKLTGLLNKANWLSFLFQIFAYASLMPAATDLYLVLPLQKMVWHADVRGWRGHGAFLKILEETAVHMRGAGATAALMAAALRELYSIGVHAPKVKSLAGTIAALGDFSKPYQIFLGGPTTSKMSIADDELALAADAVQRFGARVYVHSQYIINLSAAVTGTSESSDTGAWNTELLQKNLRYTAAIGGRGVVVHVGKSVGKPVAEALENMRAAILAALPAATAACPLLLETPAGQGSETLKGQAEFIEFVRGIADPRLRVCVDTCHVFACGHDPQAYLEAVTAADPDLLRLVHFNDSQEACGSCLDRHAYIGTGKIGMERMTRLAEFCSERAVPMVIE
jgi:deoxyribonuclease IV